MGNEIFEEIKKKYKKSNKYMLCVSYEDIGILIQIIETMNKRKLQDMTFEYFNDNELQAIDDIKRELTDEDRREYMSKWFADDLQILVNLIEKQSEEKERKAYIKGTNDADELCNKKWKDKIKAKIEDYKKEQEFYDKNEDREWGQFNNWDWIDRIINEMQSLLNEEE